MSSMHLVATSMAKGIVIDGFGQGDDVEALFAQAVGGLGGAVAAQHKQAVEL